MENFTISLVNATNGARLGNNLIASLRINKNDNPIYFSGKEICPLSYSFFLNYSTSVLYPSIFSIFFLSLQNLSWYMLGKERSSTSLF